MTVSESDWNSLHPASVLVNLVPRTWAFVRRSWVLLVALLYGRQGGDQVIGMVDMVLLLIFFMGTVGGTVVHYLTLRYRVSGSNLEIQTGLLNRQLRVIGADRIQNTELVRNVFHRMSGLVEVRIETASGSEIEGMLSALDEASATSLIAALDTARSKGQAAPDVTEEADWPVLISTTPVDLLWYGVTGARFGAMVVAGGVMFELLTQRDPTQIERLPGMFGAAGGLALFVAAVLGAWLVSVGSSLIRHWGFRLRQKGGSLVAEEGLFTRRRVELGRRKIQVVSILEPAMRRMWLRIASVQVETAAVREGGDGTQRAVALVPVVHEGRLDALMQRLLPMPSDTSRFSELVLRPPADKALLRRWLASTWQIGLVVVGVVWWFGWTGLPAVVLLPAAWGLALLDHRHQGWVVTDELVVSREGWWSRRTEVVERAKLQSVDRVQGPILRRYGLGRVVLRVAGGAIALPIIDWELAAEIQEALLVRVAPPPPPPPAVLEGAPSPSASGEPAGAPPPEIPSSTES